MRRRLLVLSLSIVLSLFLPRCSGDEERTESDLSDTAASASPAEGQLQPTTTLVTDVDTVTPSSTATATETGDAFAPYSETVQSETVAPSATASETGSTATAP